MTKTTFYQGLKQIGGTFVTVETERAICMFDFGFAISDRADDRIKKRMEYYAEDYVRLGILPKVDGIYEKEVSGRLNVLPYGETEKECFVLISHMHIDHMGGLGLLHKDVPVYMSDESERLYQRLAINNDVEYRKHENCTGVSFGEEITILDITVKVLPIDHDVIGASGFLITTPDGTICYTGDYRFHGFHKEYSEAFAQSAKGADLLITEGVTVSFQDIDMISLEEPEEDDATEETLQKELSEYSGTEKGLIIINPYNRNVERIHRLIHTLKKAGRILVLDAVQADYVKEFYPEDPISVYRETRCGNLIPETWLEVTRMDLLRSPEQFVLQLDYKDMHELLDIAHVVTLYIHMDGAPLGEYDPSYQKMMALLENLGIPYESKGLGGHARPYDLRHMIDTIEPSVLVPLHSFRPEQVMSEKIKKRILPETGDLITLPLDC